MNYLKMLCVYIKRHILSSFLLALLIMPFLALGVRYFIPENSIGLKAGVYFEADDDLSLQLAKELTEHTGYVVFEITDSRSTLEDGVKKRMYECGYIIPSDISQRIEKLNLKSSIECGESPSSIMSGIIDEIVFSKLMKCCGGSVADIFAQKNNMELDSTQLKEKYENYITSDDIFRLTFEKTDTVTAPIVNTKPGSVVRGLIAIYIMLGGLLGTLSWYKDEEKGIHLWGMGNAMAAVILMCIFGFAALMLCGEITDIGRELILMALYGFGVLGCSCLLKTVFRSSTVMCGAYPIITIGALCLCPVLFDPGVISHHIAQLGKIFIPYHYIDYVNGGNINGLLFAAVLCWVLYYIAKFILRD